MKIIQLFIKKLQHCTKNINGIRNMCYNIKGITL